LNGLYWGIYDAAELPDATFASAYLGGRPSDYDVIEVSKSRAGTSEAFNALNAMRGRTGSYDKLRQYLDIEEFIDYLLLNYYAGNHDVGQFKNWYAVRRRNPASPFQYLVWDGERVLEGVWDDTVNNPSVMPFRLAEVLRGSAEYRLAFADRVQKHCFDDGALTPRAAAERWMKRAQEVDRAIVAESARWGYYRREQPFTRDRDWVTEQRRLIQHYFPQRTGIVLKQLRAAGLYPNVSAPEFHKEPDGTGLRLSITSQSGGVIYFTSNGVDPRVSGTGEVARGAQAYGEALMIRRAAKVKARVLKDGVWSALNEAGFADGSTN